MDKLNYSFMNKSNMLQRMLEFTSDWEKKGFVSKIEFATTLESPERKHPLLTITLINGVNQVQITYVKTVIGDELSENGSDNDNFLEAESEVVMEFTKSEETEYAVYESIMSDYLKRFTKPKNVN
ncbi:hypothetical protein CN918_31130 [Priestia megaterium]|nr:hypothetical protein CN918_31130 [Priestia megaterium]